MSATHSVSPPARGSAYLGLTKIFNRAVMPFAGTRLVPLYGVLVHRGRRSGNTFRTPVVVRATSDGFVIPMPWGEGTDWCRNVRAAGECVVRWKGREYRLERPEVISAAQAMAAFSPWQRGGFDRFGITHCMRLHRRT
jgi:deazaflavin-dependent oxidoreductase (nitroreductase family)